SACRLLDGAMTSCACARSFCFSFTPATELYSLSLHDALPILSVRSLRATGRLHHARRRPLAVLQHGQEVAVDRRGRCVPLERDRSEEHTSELQSPCNLVCRLLLEKKKQHQTQPLLPRLHRAPL